MEYTVSIEALPKKEYLVIKGFVELGGNTPDAYAEQEHMLNELIDNGSVARLQKGSGSQTVYSLFCNTCVLDAQTGGYICGNDLACENVNHVSAGDGFDVVNLDSSIYAVFSCSFGNDISKAQACKMIDDVYWGEWLAQSPYESMIETRTGANTKGIACISFTEPLVVGSEGLLMKVWFPIRRKPVTASDFDCNNKV